MKMTVVLSLVLLLSCAKKPDKNAIENQLARYANFIEEMKPDSLASFYLPAGSLSGEGATPIVGPDSISTFLKKFSDFNVLKYTISTDSIQVRGDTIVSTGGYYQKVVIPSGDTLELGGKIICQWLQHRDNWMLQRMHTFDYKNLKKKND